MKLRKSIYCFSLLAMLSLAVFASGVPASQEPRIIELAVNASTGSAEPNLTRGSDGTTVLSWQEPLGDRTLLRFSRLDAAGWSEPGTVVTGESWFVNWADFPSVLAVTGQFWAAHWLQKRPGGTYSYDVNLVLSTDGGKNWSKAITPHKDQTATEHGFVSLYPSADEVGLVWLDGRKTASSGNEPAHGQAHAGDHSQVHGPGGMTLRHARISADGAISQEIELDGLVCDCCQTSVAMSNQGPVVVYRNRTENEIRDIYIIRHVDGEWLAGRPVHEDGWKTGACPVNGPAVAAQGDAVAAAWFTMAGDVPRVRYARSEDGGASFGPPIEIAENSPLGRVDLKLLDNGYAAVSWLDQLPGGTGEFRLLIISPEGRLSEPFTISHMKTGRPSGFPQIQVDGNDLVVAWTEGSESGRGREGSIIKSARISWSPEAFTPSD